MKPHPRDKKPIRKGGRRPAADAGLIFSLAARSAAANGAEILEHRLNDSGTLRLVIDRDDGPVDSDLLVRVIRSLRQSMTENNIDPGDFQIEVDSPGKRRLLKTARHFERFAGERVRVKLKKAVEGRSSVLVRLLGESDGRPRVEDQDGEEILLEPGDYREIRLEP